MRIVVDTRQQKGKHDAKHEWLAAHGHELVRRKLGFGDYALDVEPVMLSIDTKRNVSEVAMNLCTKHHDVFVRECERANAAGARLVVLVENTNGFLTVSDVARWVNDECLRCALMRKGECDPNGLGRCNNPRHKRTTAKPVQGKRLAQTILHTSEHHGVEFMFCAPQDAGRLIESILRKEVREDGEGA